MTLSVFTGSAFTGSAFSGSAFTGSAFAGPAVRDPARTPWSPLRRRAVAGGIFRDALLVRANIHGEIPDPTEAGCVELLNITRPTLVADMHKRLLRTGADMLFTNTSGAAPHLLDRYRMHDEAFAVSYLGAEIASRVAREAARGDCRPRVIGDVRMPWHMPVHGFIPGTEVEAAAASMTSAQVAGGVDAIRLQVSCHPGHMIAAFNGARVGMAEAGRRVPVLVSVRHDMIGLPSDDGSAGFDLISAASLAHSFGATALSIDGSAPNVDVLSVLIALAETLDAALFIAPGATEETIRRCIAHPTIAERLAFVGVETPAHAWRISRFTPAKGHLPLPRIESANDNAERRSAPNTATSTPRIGTA